MGPKASAGSSSWPCASALPWCTSRPVACMAERGYKTLSLVMDDRLHKMPNKADMLVGTSSEMADALVHIEAQLIKHVG